MAKRSGGEVIPIDQARDMTPVPAPQAEPNAISFRDYLSIFYKRRWVMAVFFAVVVGAAGVWLVREPRVYRAVSSLEISPVAPRYLGTGVQDVAESGATMYWQTKEFFETQYQIIRSRAVAQRVSDKLGLTSDPAFLGVAAIKDPAKQRQAMVGADPVARLQGMIRVEPVKDSRIVRLAVEDTDRERAALIANAYGEAYIEHTLDKKLDTTRAASLWLADQLDDLKKKLESSEVGLHHFKRENDILTASFEDKQSISSQRLLALNDALTKARTRRAELESRRRTLAEAKKRAVAGDPAAFDSVAAVAQSVLVGQLKLRLVALTEEREELASRYLPQHPRLLAVEERLAEISRTVDRETGKIVAALDNEFREASDTEQQLVALIDGAKREAFEVNKREIDYVKLKREQENNQRLYDLVLQRLKDAELTGMLRTSTVQLLDAALVPSIPVKPNRKVVMILSIILGLLGAVSLALFFEYLDNTVKTHDDVERYLQLPFLGIVPSIHEKGQEQLPVAERGRNRDLHAHRRPKSSVAECIRSVRTNLLFMTPDKPLKRLLITSSGPQEGKTTVAVNLAIAFSQAGSRVLLVDTDMRRPRIHRAFGLPNDAGVSSLMLQSARLEDVVKETAVPNLFLLPCGPIPPNPAELIHTERFKKLLLELDAKYDRVIFDSPPVAAVTDALILSGDVDGVVLVAKAGRTVREVAMRTRQSLADVNARLFGMVLNDLDLERRGYGYYYYYQKYGYYYGEKVSEA
jgi:capsular exopolysaccharide synthesis family protein